MTIRATPGHLRVGILLALLAFLGAPLQAQSPEDIPEPEPPQAVQSAATPPSSSADPSDPGSRVSPLPFRDLWITGYVQQDFDDGSLRAATASSNKPVTNGIGIHPVDSRLLLRRARVDFHLPVGTDAAFKITVPVEDGFGSGVFDAYLEVKLPQQVDLMLGQHKVRWGYEGLRGSWNLDTIERTDATRGIYQFRDTGFTVRYGREGPFRADLGVFQGRGQGSGGDPDSRSAAYRLSWRLGDHWTIENSGQYGVFDSDPAAPTAPGLLPLRRQDVCVRYDGGPWRLETELMFSDGYNSMAQVACPAWGGYVAGVRQVDEHLDAVLEYDWFDPDVSASDPWVANNRTNARNRTVLGLNWYLSREDYHRIMLNYEFHGEVEGPRISNDGFRVRYQFRF